MTNQEIIDYFSGSPVYTFTGKPEDLQRLQEDHGSSFNYLRTPDIIYFTTASPAVDSRISVFTGN